MEEVFIAFLQFVFELALSIFANVPFDWPSKNRRTPEPESIWLAGFWWFLGGCLVAWISTLFMKHTFISVPALRMLNIVVAPIASAYFSQAIARRRSKININIVPRNHFWQAFWFTLGLVLVRFAYAARA
jgi:hypothetical protein